MSDQAQPSADQLVHRVCNWIAEEINLVTNQRVLDKCKECPQKIDTPYGEAQQMCYGRAMELIELVRGNAP